MRFGWIARNLARETGNRVRYSLFRPWQRYDAVVFMKSMGAGCRALARQLRDRGTPVICDVNVDYFTPAEGTFYYQGMAPTTEQAACAQEFASLSDALIADSIHIERVCVQHHPKVRWIPDNVEWSIVPPYQSWKRNGKLDLLWSGEAVKLFELLSILPVLRKFASQIRLVLVTNDLAALDRWFEPWKSRFEELLASVEHRIVPFTTVEALLGLYGQGGVFISPRFLDNTYNWGHTEWKITLPMACGRMALGSPLPSYREVGRRSEGAGLRLCENDEEWVQALDELLSGGFDFAMEENAARAVVQEHYSTPVVAAAHRAFIAEVCSGRG
jgi:glycosyltransferase involved in cell wall biosynthesis